MSDGETRAGWKDWTAALLPSVAVLLFGLLHRKLPGPSAAGLSFLAVLVAAYLLFPRIRLNLFKLTLGVLAALALALALLAGLGRL